MQNFLTTLPPPDLPNTFENVTPCHWVILTFIVGTGDEIEVTCS